MADDDSVPQGGTLVRLDQDSPAPLPDRNLIERFVSLSGTLARSSSVADAAEAIGVAALALAGGQRGAVYAHAAGGATTRVWASDHSVPDQAPLMEAGPALFPDVKDLPESHEVRRAAERAGYRALASWPLTHAGKALGSVVCCFDAPRAWPPAELDVMSALAMQAGATLERALSTERNGGVQPVTSAEDARIIEVLRILLTESTSLREAHRALEAEHARLAQARRELGALNIWLLGLENELRSERSRLAAERHELASEDARIAAARRALEAQIAAAREELENESARLMAEMRRELSHGLTRAPAPPDAPVEPRREGKPAAGAVPISDARRVLEEEGARLMEALGAETLAMAPPAGARPAPDGRSETADAEPAFELGGPLPAPRGLEELFPLLVERAAKLLNTDRGSLAADDQVKILGRALDDRDGHRAGYSERLEAWAEATAGVLGCGREQIADIRRAALLHDLGKIGVPDAILQGAGQLTEQQRRIVRGVPTLAEQVLRPVKGMDGVAAILRHRYEQWDGKGYPDGLKGDAIPLGARVLAVVDAYGVMTTIRPYRAMVYSLDAVAELRRCAGAQFDPRVVEAFCNVLKREG